MPHDDANHENHLCQVSQKGINDDYKKLVKDGKFVCGNCGRVAASDKSLCAPEPL
jgi:hypothetical protein